MSVSSPSPNDDFAARLERIRARQGQAILMVGQDEHLILPRKEVHPVSRKREIAVNALYPASLLGAVVLGVFAVSLGKYAHFHMMETVAELQDPINELVFVAVIGVCLSFVLSQAFKLTSKEHRTLQGIGIFVMVGMFHNLSHWVPGPMASMFSPQWVLETVATTPRSTFRLGQRYFPIFAETASNTPAGFEAGLIMDQAANDPLAAADRPCLPNAQTIGKPEVLIINPEGEAGSRKSIKITSAAAADAPTDSSAPQVANCLGD